MAAILIVVSVVIVINHMASAGHSFTQQIAAEGLLTAKSCSGHQGCSV